MIQGAKRTDSSSFVLTLWLEPAEASSPDWRWKVHHVQTGEEKFFKRLADVLDFVASCARVDPPQLSAFCNQQAGGV